MNKISIIFMLYGLTRVQLAISSDFGQWLAAIVTKETQFIDAYTYHQVSID